MVLGPRLRLTLVSLSILDLKVGVRIQISQTRPNQKIIYLQLYNFNYKNTHYIYVGTTSVQRTVDQTNHRARPHERPGPRKAQEVERPTDNPINTFSGPTDERVDNLRERSLNVKSESCVCERPSVSSHTINIFF